MTHDHYVPVLLNCRGRLCLIVGGGKVAERKALTLLNAGASVHIVSPVLRSETLRHLAGEKALQWTERKYRPDDPAGAFMVHAATDDAKLNLKIAEDADRLGVLVNVASDGEAGTFINPTVLRRGRLMLAVSTSGAGPMAARDIRDELEERFGPEYEDYLDFLYRMRSMIKDEVKPADARRRLLQKAYRMDMLGEIRRGGYVPWSPDEIKQWIEKNQEE
ncbi:bifunctional precorrin-2 dehydrogenase/sirohydrochlorin ferrochelatase [Paenibacillus sp. Y412MC10]|uniref:precorrin-2 dehydrogenase/sirohydrochlorin ferrochelatase family protein n=1 Tax=Geobacillus sp. (strain Y412MC10) TaxID=481743 RepID=UPI0011A1352B|nr:NAD(P)-dependent oxidoreductase [Paenibacillus sp. Y412MC10]